MKAVGKISRRVSLVRYPEPQELEKEKPGFGSLMTPGSKKSAGSSRKTMSRFTSASKNRSSQGSAFSLGQHSAEPASKHKQKKRRDESSLGHSNMSGKSSQGSQARGTESNTTSEIPHSPGPPSQPCSAPIPAGRSPRRGLWPRKPVFNATGPPPVNPLWLLHPSPPSGAVPADLWLRRVSLSESSFPSSSPFTILLLSGQFRTFLFLSRSFN